MYSVTGYGKMIADHHRLSAYREALSRVVRPDTVVLDVGCGTGIFSLIACQLGARKVYAVEPDEAIQLAKEIAVDNGYGDRIIFIQQRADQISLPDKADVMVSDLRGVLPLFGHHIPAAIDARARLLAADGFMIAERDTLWAAVLEAPHLYGRVFNAWNDSGHGLNLTAARNLVANTWGKARVEASQLLAEPQCWATLNYRTIESAHVSAAIEFTARRAGLASGLVVWFDSQLLEGITLSNAPSAPELIYGSGFFPWPNQVAVAEQDHIQVRLDARLIGGDYLWSWDTTVREAGAAARVKAAFRQTSFRGAPLAPSTVKMRAASFVPQLSDIGQLDSWILGAMDGVASLGEIAHGVMARFPGQFGDWPAALAAVADLAKRYSCRPESPVYRRQSN